MDDLDYGEEMRLPARVQDASELRERTLVVDDTLERVVADRGVIGVPLISMALSTNPNFAATAVYSSSDWEKSLSRFGAGAIFRNSGVYGKKYPIMRVRWL